MTHLDTDFFLRPLEPLFFGEPHPFNAGETHYARSLFPPSPMTMQGIVRTQLLRAAHPALDLDDWSESARRERADLVGSSGRLPDGWRIQAPLPAEIKKDAAGVESLHPWAPAPRFLYSSTDRGNRVFPGMIISSEQPAMNDLEPALEPEMKHDLMIGGPDEEQYPGPLNGWVDPGNLWWALSGKGSWRQQGFAPLVPPFVKTTQRQPGIALDQGTNTARDGMLYLLEHLRFSAASGFWGHFSGSLDRRIRLRTLSRGVGGAGRKGRLIAFEDAPQLEPRWRDLLAGRHLPLQPENQALFWLYLLTPARMRKEPDTGGHDQILPGVGLQTESLPAGTALKCRAALTGRPITLGGMDTAMGRTRPNHAYVPAGSAWLIEIKAGNDQQRREILEKLNNTHLLGDAREARFGFGHTLVGIGYKNKEYNHE